MKGCDRGDSLLKMGGSGLQAMHLGLFLNERLRLWLRLAALDTGSFGC